MKLIISMLFIVATLFGAVDINHATQKELTTLKGIGKTKADAIIKYRRAHCFKSIDEIVKVKGIGKAFLKNNKDNLKVKSCKKH